MIAKIKKWYSTKPTWVKALLFILPLLAILLFVLKAIFFSPKDIGNVLVDMVRSQSKDHEKKLIKKDKELAEQIKEEQDERKEREKEREKNHEAAINIHDSIDNATSISELDNIDTDLSSGRR